MNNWAETIINTIDSKLAGTKQKELRFYRIDEFKRNIQRTDSFSSNCPYCNKRKTDITDQVQKIDEAIHVPGKTRRDYDRLISQLSTHMQKEHGFYTPYYFAYLYSFFGMVVGLVLGYLLLKLFPSYDWAMLSLGFSVSLIASYIWGSVKDRKIRSTKKLM